MSNNPFPYIPSISTELRLAHFDPDVYDATPDTILYRWMDAMCGSSGAGSLVNQTMLTRMSVALETMYYNELDYIFGKVSFLSRAPEESYPYNPQTDMLTTAQWDEVRVKDAWFRQRIKDFWIACGLGGTPDGLRMGIQAALGVDADIYEVHRYIDNFGITENLGRAPVPARNEVVIAPHKTSLDPGEIRLARDMLDRFAPIGAIITINPLGLAVSVPVPLAAAASDSIYYEVVKTVTPTPVLAQIPAPEFLPINLNTSEQWLFSDTPVEAPTAAFNSTSEYSYYYLSSGGTRSQIDSVSYGTLNSDGSVTPEVNFQEYATTGSYSAWAPYPKADSPDNYPGGRNGIHPGYAPALNPDGTPYIFPYPSQAQFVTDRQLQIEAQGGQVTPTQYRLPIQATNSNATVFYPDDALASSPPPRDSTVSASLTQDRGGQTSGYSSLDSTTFARTS